MTRDDLFIVLTFHSQCLNVPCWMPKVNIYRLNITSKTQKQNHPIAQRCEHRLHSADTRCQLPVLWLTQLQPPNNRQASLFFLQQMAVRFSRGPLLRNTCLMHHSHIGILWGQSCSAIGIFWLLLCNAWDWYIYENTSTLSNKWIFKSKSRPDRDGYVITTWIPKQKVSRPQAGSSSGNTRDVLYCKYNIKLWTKVYFWFNGNKSVTAA